MPLHQVSRRSKSFVNYLEQTIEPLDALGKFPWRHGLIVQRFAARKRTEAGA